MDEFNEETQFVADEVSGIVKETIEQVIGGQTYCNTKVSQWTSAVVEGCLLGLTGLQKPFKYIGKNCYNNAKKSAESGYTPLVPVSGIMLRMGVALSDGKIKVYTV
ncbi:Dynein light chain Tctex-type 1 [Orchesella cincta]|uniref:Dynein light chain Tctex-type 1 n=1 Tax=Orchesella cincta TaxID=48709 RepID=A0A1D2MS10_ORCCI|nr:Dynein light chain Tctex-type 1 [Orchesella cincta]